MKDRTEVKIGSLNMRQTVVSSVREDRKPAWIATPKIQSHEQELRYHHWDRVTRAPSKGEV